MGATPHSPTSVLQLLRDAADAAGPAERRLVDAIAAGYPRSILTSTPALLREAGADPDVYDQLVRAAGFRDVTEMRWCVREEIDRSLRSPEMRYAERLDADHQPDLLQRVIDNEVENARSSLQGAMETGALTDAARIIVAARARFIVGERKSYAFAHLLGVDLAALLNRVTIIDGLVSLPSEVIVNATEADACVVFSFRRYARSTLHIARELKAAGTPLILITDAADSPLTPLASTTLLVETASQSFADSPTGTAALIHALVTLIATRAKGARRRLARREEIIHNLCTYEEG